MNFMHCFPIGSEAYSGFTDKNCLKASEFTPIISEFPAYMYITHSNIPRVTATAALFICILCSIAINM